MSLLLLHKQYSLVSNKCPWFNGTNQLNLFKNESTVEFFKLYLNARLRYTVIKIMQRQTKICRICIIKSVKTVKNYNFWKPTNFSLILSSLIRFIEYFHWIPSLKGNIFIQTKWLKVCKTFCFVKYFEIFSEKHRP